MRPEGRADLANVATSGSVYHRQVGVIHGVKPMARADEEGAPTY